METEIDPIKSLPRLRLGALQTPLYAYRISPYGIFFVEATEEGESSGQVNFVTSGIILKAAGEKFHDEEIGKLMAQNALENIVEVSSSGLVAC